MGTRAQGTTTKLQRKMNVIADWVCFLRVSEEVVTPGNIILPETDASAEEGDVVAIGPQVQNVLPGDRIKFVGCAIQFACDGTTYYLARDATPKAEEMRNDQYGNPIGAPFVVAVLRRTEQYQ